MALGGGAGEAIPREYHRRVLKKIAQLTKVLGNSTYVILGGGAEIAAPASCTVSRVRAAGGVRTEHT